MSADVNIIIRNNFYELDNLEKSRTYVLQTIEKIKQKLHSNGDFTDIEIVDDYYSDEDKFSEIKFNIISQRGIVRLAKGYWSIHTCCHACQITNKHLGRLHIADLAFDMAMLFDVNEVWYCDEDLEYKCWTNSLEEMIEIAREKGEIEEYPYVELMKHDDYEFPDYKQFYHDSLEHIRKEYEELVTKCGDYKPISIEGIGRGFVKVTRGGKMNLVRRDTASVVFNFDVDNIDDFSGGEMLCYNNGKTALLDIDSNLITDFVEGDFYTKLENSPCGDIKLFVNEVSQITIMCPNYRKERR